MTLKYLAIIIVTIFFVSCSSETEYTAPKDNALGLYKYMPPNSNDNFEFVDSKVEQKGTNTNSMEIYVPKGKLDIEALKKLCTGRKFNHKTGNFFYVVIFDKKENVSFSEYPLTAAYGDEEKKMKHIKAFYTYNRVNGYSKLGTYKKNMYESAVEEVDI